MRKCEYSGRDLQGEEKFADEIYNRKKKRKGKAEGLTVRD
jgi:hypothetical protein